MKRAADKSASGVRRRKNPISFLWKFSSASFFSSVTIAILLIGFIWLVNRKYHIFLGIPFTLKLLLVAAVLAAGVSYLLGKVFVDPIVKLTDAMNLVADGNFEVKLETKSKIRDIRQAYSCFNKMVTELANTETLQTDFVSNVSHEFKTPINAIEGYASLLQDSHISSEEVDGYVEKIIFNTHRLSDLVGNILLLSKINSKSIQPKASRFRLDEQIRSSFLSLESKWANKDLDFDIELEEIEYTGSENLLLHVWLNLIDNAVKFTPVGGKIRILLYCEDEKIVFRIWNNGPPIPSEAHKRIFTRFYQLDSSRRSDGSGLGLALVKNILDTLGSEISVTSDEESGTEFTVTLPTDFLEDE